MQSQRLVLDEVSASYGSQNVLTDLSLTVEPGELVSLLGSSGCGKTTTLRLVAGFLYPSAGKVRLGDREITRLPPHRRDIGIVFQNYALLPHLSVLQNVEFGLKQRRVPSAERRRRAMDMLATVGLAEFAERAPSALSGGQKQRVALARALVINPPLLMFDEPLSNLDAKLRVDMRVHIRALQKANECTAIYVTHDQEEAFAISDRVAIMNAGRIVQFDTPENLYNRPRNSFVARFVGFENLLEMQVVERDGKGVSAQMKGGVRVRFEHADFPDIPDRFVLAARPEGMIVSPGADGDIPVRLGIRTYLGRTYLYHCHCEAGRLLAHGPADAGGGETPDSASIRIDPGKCALLPAEDEPEDGSGRFR